MVALELVDISKDYHDSSGRCVPVLKQLSFAVPAGAFCCVLGPSGCGKTTILNIVAGLISPDSGAVRVCSTSNTQESARISYVFQQHRLLPWKTVEGNLEFVLRATGVPASEWHGRQRECLALVGLDQVREQFPATLSEGMRQRVAIARSLVVRPTLLLMDEPLSHLDELTARALRHDLAALCYTGSYTVLFVTHNAAEASYLADQVVVLSNKPTCVRAEMRLDTSRPRDFEGYATLRAQRELLRLLGVTGGEPDVPKNSQMV